MLLMIMLSSSLKCIVFNKAENNRTQGRSLSGKLTKLDPIRMLGNLTTNVELKAIGEALQPNI